MKFIADEGVDVFIVEAVRAGIVLSRLEGLPGELKAKIVATVIEKNGETLVGAFTVIQPGRVRIRKY